VTFSTPCAAATAHCAAATAHCAAATAHCAAATAHCAAATAHCAAATAHCAVRTCRKKIDYPQSYHQGGLKGYQPSAQGNAIGAVRYTILRPERTKALDYNVFDFVLSCRTSAIDFVFLLRTSAIDFVFLLRTSAIDFVFLLRTSAIQASLMAPGCISIYIIKRACGRVLGCRNNFIFEEFLLEKYFVLSNYAEYLHRLRAQRPSFRDAKPGSFIQLLIRKS